MKISVSSMLGGLILALASLPAAADSIARAKTSAEILDADAAEPVVQLEFRAVYRPDRPASIVDDDILVTWQRVGGVEPTPFQILLPAGCFVESRNFVVRDFVRCGGDAAFRDGPLEVLEFAARMIRRENSTLRLDIRAVVTVDDAAPELLSVLGGAEISVAIGGGSASLLPRDISTVSGIEPTPF